MFSSKRSCSGLFLHTFLFFGIALFRGEAASDHNEDFSAPSEYLYAYNVNDPTTGDEKRHHESNFGGVVRGFYSVRESDGTTRLVHYTADEVNGFTARVKKIGRPNKEAFHHSPPMYWTEINSGSPSKLKLKSSTIEDSA